MSRQLFVWVAVPLAIVVLVFTTITTNHNRQQVRRMDRLDQMMCRDHLAFRRDMVFILRNQLHLAKQHNPQPTRVIARDRARLAGLPPPPKCS